MRALLIAEKPSLNRTIQEVYMKNKNIFSDQIDFCCFRGHVVGLMEPREYSSGQWANSWSWEILPFNPTQFQYKATNQSLFKEIKEKLEKGNYDYLINACDPEREGNHIFQLFYMYSGCKLPCKRFWTNELTDETVKNALLNLRYEGDGKLPNLRNLTNAALLRARFDLLVGMNFTIAGSLAMKQIARIGRVKTPTLCILGQREEEIQNFKPTTRYELEAIYKEGFNGVLFDKDGNISFDLPNGFNDIKAKLGNQATVTLVEKKQEKTNPPVLFNLSGLQSAASKTYGYSIDLVLETAQSLYEKKVLSYPRTDCTAVGSDTAKQFKNLLNSVASHTPLQQYVNKVTDSDIANTSKNKSYVNDAALAEGGHYALIPTTNKPDWNSLTEIEKNVLILVYKRFLSIFMPPQIANKMKVITDNNGFTFKSTGKSIQDKGWKILYNEEEDKDTMLPPLNKGDIVNVTKFETKEKTTTPPKRYTDGDLVEIMQNPMKFLEDEGLKTILKVKKGIGTEATRSSIINELMNEKSKYVEKRKGKGKAELLYVTPLGMTLYHNFKDFDFAKVDMTGFWETKLGDVENGTMTPQQFDKEMREYVLNGIDTIKNSKDIKQVSFAEMAEPLGICPACGLKNVVEGKSWYMCQNYKNGCEFIFAKEWYGAKITKTEAKKIVAKKRSKEYNMSTIDKTTKEKKEWTSALLYNPNTKRVEFAPREVKSSNGLVWKANGTEVGNCPKCGKPVLYHGNCCKCDGEGGCGWFMSAKLKGATITENDFKKLLNGKEVKKTFTWASGKSSEAGVKLVGEKINFVFPEKK